MSWIAKYLPSITGSGVAAVAGVAVAMYASDKQISQVEQQIEQTEREYARDLDINFSQYAERIGKLELELARLKGDLSKRDAQLASLEAEVANQPDLDSAALDSFEERLQLVEKRRQSSSVSVDSVAAALMRDYGDQLRGPQGEPGPAGPMGLTGPKGEKGEAGQAGAGSKLLKPMQDPNVLENFAFSSDFDTKRLGNLKVDLVECLNGGNSVDCEYQVEWTGDSIAEIEHRADFFRIALETSEWHRGDQLTILNKTSPSNSIRHDFIPNLPVRLQVNFKGASSKGNGLPIVRYCTYGCNSETTWDNVAFAN